MVSSTVSLPVHPRAGGEHPLFAWRDQWCAGSSPRGRGTPDETKDYEEGIRFIPARAGNTDGQRGQPSFAGGSSPRGRGATVHKLVHRVAVSPKGRATAPSKLSEVVSCELPAELAEHYASTFEQRLLDQVLHAAMRTIAVCGRLHLARQAKPSSG